VFGAKRLRGARRSLLHEFDIRPPHARRRIDMGWIVVYNVLEMLKWLIVIRAIMSWFVPPNSSNPIVNFIRRVTDWVLRPISDMLPRTGGMDLSPVVGFFAIILLQQVIIRLV
jgi:uncharacterized protein YggT (Ycf19 family)